MIQKEIIEITQVVQGTNVVNFYGLDHPDFQTYPLSYLLMDATGKPLKIVENEFDVDFKRLPDNTFQYVGPDVSGNSSTSIYITGRTYTQFLNYEIAAAQQGAITQKFINSNKPVYGTGYTYWVQFDKASANDMYANISMVKTYNMLNTLSVLNSVEGVQNFRESPTGVVFGKLEAVQKINDADGNKVRVPLANVPVAIFNATDEFPDISSLDEDGNRIVLNLLENSTEEQYFNNETFQFAQSFLSNTQTIKNVPDKYRYSALTNDKGEFVLYDIPTGSQTFMMEVDLLKQGLTKDEVALNFFPYPTTSNPNVDEVPHFYFKQFSINVVPSWSDFQSGYTQLNVSAPVDLRKWTSYIFPPAGYAENEKLEETVSKNANRKLKIQIRDMTSKGSDGTLYPIKSLTLSKIQDDLDRDENSQYIWFNEFAENRSRVDYNEFGCFVVKLPANLYDPDGYKTDSNGFSTLNKGVWLSAYQLKEFIEETVSSRATGGYSYWMGGSSNDGYNFYGNGNFYLLSHFDLNYTFGNDTKHTTYSVGEDAIRGQSQIGQFPYEQPWSINYPSKYSIPQKPVIQRFASATDGVQRAKYDNNGHFFMEEPAYEDGDLVGLDATGGLPAAGFGLQYIPDPTGDGPGLFFPNRISEVATQNFMYKYESGIAWNEMYANGFQPFWDTPSTDQPFGGYSKVVNGERYQRLESGYGYFMKPQGWPRYVRASWGADIPSQDIQSGLNAVTAPRIIGTGLVGEMYSPKTWFEDIYNIDKQNLTLALGNNNNITRGGIDIYRIVESGVNNIVTPKNFVLPTYAALRCGSAELAFRFVLRNDGSITANMVNRFGRRVFYEDANGNIQVAQKMQPIKLAPGKTIFVNGDGESYSNTSDGQGNAIDTLSWVGINLPGNSNYSTDLNQYTSAIYYFEVHCYGAEGGSDVVSFEFNVGADTTVPSYWIRTITDGGDHGVAQSGISKRFSYGKTSYAHKPIRGLIYDNKGDIENTNGDKNQHYGYYL